MTDYGFCTWTLGDITLNKKLEIAASLGVTGVEIEGDLKQDPLQIKQQLKKYNLKPLSITPQDVDISSCNEETRQAAVQYYLDLIDWTAKIGAPRFCIHGQVGKISWDHNLDVHWDLLVNSVQEVTSKASEKNLEVVYEVLNRYENYQVLTAATGLKLIQAVANSNLKLLLDAYHMNIEENDPAAALISAAAQLGVYHIADSNRQAIGDGHTNFSQQFKALKEIHYQGPLIMEMTAAGPNPFTPMKGQDYLSVVTDYYQRSLQILHAVFGD
ncbi:sugar phosphate isomerase/epimerase family protein [Bombilactobacillus mellis]|uniref:sugar phosphate isomerase/epimerase family protein n=1 Tax=Bombilactobacillus mellis TaxID=1218508 RepID=UPI001580772A|nr:sugar phosphate isomerase/epimerase family protein [Bombilactobacillus mellis]NUF25938.1 sugar phosphate isomerase/epimerase [Bombilactobacillus mellis]